MSVFGPTVNLFGVLSGGRPIESSPPALTVDTLTVYVIIDNRIVRATGVTGLAVPDPSPADRSIIAVNASGAWVVLAGSDPAGNGSVVPFVQVPWEGPFMTQILDEVLQDPQNDLRKYVELPEPGHSLVYTYLTTALSLADPGAGNFGFDSLTPASIAHMYVSYKSATSGSARRWFELGTGSLPGRYIRFWSRQDPALWSIYKVNSVTDHSTYSDVGVTFVAGSSTIASVPLTADTYDTAMAWEVLDTGAVASVFGRTGAVTAVTGDYPGQLLGIRHLFNGTTSYTPTSGTGSIYVECVGGGAGVAASGASTAVGASGAGAYAASRITAVNAGAHTVAIGAGGSAGANNGGTTSFTLAGGESGTAPSAGGGVTSGATGNNPAGGAGGTASAGDLTAPGGGGGASVWVNTVTIGFGGIGGNSYFGAGGAGPAQGSNANAGGLYGGGASGSANKTSSSAAGGNGVMRIHEYT